MASELEVREAVINSLVTDATIQGVLLWTGNAGVYKVFGGDYVHEAVPRPFVMVSHFSGGQDYRSLNPSADMLFLVRVEVEVIDDPTVVATADTIAQAIHDALHLQKPTLTAGLAASYHGNNFMREQFPFKDRYMRQNRHYLQRGGVYRIILDPIGS